MCLPHLWTTGVSIKGVCTDDFFNCHICNLHTVIQGESNLKYNWFLMRTLKSDIPSFSNVKLFRLPCHQQSTKVHVILYYYRAVGRDLEVGQPKLSYLCGVISRYSRLVLTPPLTLVIQCYWNILLRPPFPNSFLREIKIGKDFCIAESGAVQDAGKQISL